MQYYIYKLGSKETTMLLTLLVRGGIMCLHYFTEFWGDLEGAGTLSPTLQLHSKALHY